MRIRSLLLASLMIMLGVPSLAQLPTVDITMVPSGPDQLEVRLRPDANFDGLFAAIVFTVRWEASSAATLSDFTSAPEVAEYNMYPDVSGEMGEANGSKYLVYAGFGSSSLLSEGQSWTAGEEFVLGHFTVSGGEADFEIVNDDWTQANNGDYYVSLNGVDRTGVIYELSTSTLEGMVDGPTTLIQPNPSVGDAQLIVQLPEAGVVDLRITDALGRLVHQERVALSAGGGRILLPGAGLGEGSYLVRLSGNGMETTVPWVLQR
ncbi:MAG: T9SS type A sorting domain-containing protein [Flavobacteriales bacterium]|nr:T9SS type A sorting domain-containing protein [Flavobacteriales bacterium]